MEKYKQRKQTNNLLHVFLLTLFIFASLFSVTGIVYSLVTVGIGSPLFLLCSIGFATCTTLSACNAYTICNNITHRRGASQKETACSIDKKLIRSKGESENLIDFDDQSVLNEKHNIRQYISCVPETDKEILTPEVVENVKQNNKPSLILSDKKSPTNQNLKSPNISQTQGSNFAGPTRGISTQQSNNPVILHQSQKNPVSPIPQSQAVKQNNSNKQDGIEHYEADRQPNSVASEFQAPPPPPPMPENSFSVDKLKIINQLQHIKGISQTKLKCVDESEKNKCSKSDNRDKLLEDIRKGVKLKPIIDISKNSNGLTDIACSISEAIPEPGSNADQESLRLTLRQRREYSSISDTDNDDDRSGHSTPDSEWEEGDVKTSPKAQVEYTASNNHDGDSGISDDNNSPERANNNIGKSRVLSRSFSNNRIEGSVEQPKNCLSHSSSYSGFTAINVNTL